MPANLLVRTSRRVSRLTQKQLGDLANVAPSSLSLIESGERNPTVATLEKLLASTGRSLVSIPTRRQNVASAADRISMAVGEKDPSLALRHFIQLNDDLAAEHAEVRFALAISEPAPTGVKHWDAAIAGLVEYRLAEESLPLPSWATSPSRYLRKTWTFNAGTYVVPVAPESVPVAFSSRKVLIDRESLNSV